MAGLRNIAKLYGGMKVNGVEYVWDYANDEPRVKGEMTREELAASERAKAQNVLDATKEHVASFIRSALPKNDRQTGSGFENF